MRDPYADLGDSGDGDDEEETVFIVPYNHVGRKPPLHTERCKHVERAATVLEKPRTVFDDDHKVCSECAGTVEPHRNDEESLAMVTTLSDQDFGPEDLGLDPLPDGGESA